MARAKHTDRSEARRRYRQTTNEAVEGEILEPEAADLDSTEPRRPARAAAQPGRPERPSFLGSFRAAYHPARVRDDLRALPSLLRSRAFLGALLLVLAGGVAVAALPNYTGTRFALEFLVWPGQALAPQLVAGFFAPRASYLLGLIIGLVQGLVFMGVMAGVGPTIGLPITSELMGTLLGLSFVTGPISGLLFAAAAAWYRRFLSLSSPSRRGAAGRQPARSAKPSRRAAR